MTAARKEQSGGTGPLLLVCLPACLLVCLLSFAGCERTPSAPPREELPLAYTSKQITDPALHRVAEEILNGAVQQSGAGGKSLYSRAEVLAVVPIVQPYGVGAYQQEPRLPVILTTGPGWAGLERKDKEAKVAEMFRGISAKLEGLKVQPPLRPTLTVQTPQGMVLAWINQLDPSGKNLHGDE